MERFVKDLEELATLVGENEVGLALSAHTRQRLADLLSSYLVAQMRLDFLSFMRRRARESDVAIDQKRAAC